jgi:HlyD family secretion protein
VNKKAVGIVALAVLLVVALATKGFGLVGQPELGLKLYGNVDVRQVELAFRVPGRIASIAFDEGSKVPAGAAIARLETRTFLDTIESAQAQVAQADADLARQQNGNRRQDISRARAQVAEQQALVRKARADLSRRESLLPSGAISQAAVVATRGEYEAALARLQAGQQALALLDEGTRVEDVRASEARRRSAAAQVARAQTDMADTVLTAPEGGTLLTRALEPGSIVQPGQTVVALTIDRPMRVRAYVAANDLSRISPGMNVIVTTDGNAKVYHGTIGNISPTAEFTPKSVQTESLRTDLVYRLRINVSDPDDALRQGQPVTVSVSAARAAPKD